MADGYPAFDQLPAGVTVLRPSTLASGLVLLECSHAELVRRVGHHGLMCPICKDTTGGSRRVKFLGRVPASVLEAQEAPTLF